uniref:Elongation of very long chain fatty acids protein n=1 Tax=Timema bartmani TaxID=61472 RepID=A0A7R9EWZ4_9NEOP|nr:unnamed protein product [Timema bartmani]
MSYSSPMASLVLSDSSQLTALKSYQTKFMCITSRHLGASWLCLAVTVAVYMEWRGHGCSPPRAAVTLQHVIIILYGLFKKTKRKKTVAGSYSASKMNGSYFHANKHLTELKLEDGSGFKNVMRKSPTDLEDLLQMFGTSIGNDWPGPHPRVNQWSMMASPFPTLAICLAYAYFAKVLGPRLMENRKPFNLRNVLIVYNFLQTIFSSWIFYEASPIFTAMAVQRRNQD